MLGMQQVALSRIIVRNEKIIYIEKLLWCTYFPRGYSLGIFNFRLI